MSTHKIYFYRELKQNNSEIIKYSSLPSPLKALFFVVFFCIMYHILCVVGGEIHL